MPIRPSRRVVATPAAFTVTVLALVAVLAVQPAGGAFAGACWLPPVDAPISDPFREPRCPWCSGNRGIEYATRPGTPVRAVAAGTVSFAGSVAGTVYVVVRHADGRRATYGRLAERRVGRGDRVVAGSIVGVTSDTFHFGLRDGDDYIDPTPFLGRLVGRPHLVPIDGRAPNAAPPPRLTCSGAPERGPAVRQDTRRAPVRDPDRDPDRGHDRGLGRNLPRPR